MGIIGKDCGFCKSFFEIGKGTRFFFNVLNVSMLRFEGSDQTLVRLNKRAIADLR